MTFFVTILGSSSALPTSKRFPSAHVLNAHGRLFLIDCGEGTQIQLRKYKLRLSRIDSIFITHVHGDHTLGLVGLIATLNLLGRKTKLSIFAHASLQPILNQNILFFVNELNFPIEFIPLNSKKHKVILKTDNIIVESFPLKHRIPCNGFLFRESPKLPNIKKEAIEKYQLSLTDITSIKRGSDFTSETGEVIPNAELTYISSPPRSYAYCSDTRYFEKLANYTKNVDLLYHEATFDKRLEKMAKTTGHSTAEQAAQIAKLSNAKKLIIGHYSSRYKDITPLLDEARLIFPETYSAEDGLVFSI
ncbi:MAG TPA: ribonuclease Z [Bacteroidales bacterium]|nr:ribonuclease Z [Bacteroidales bacterium]